MAAAGAEQSLASVVLVRVLRSYFSLVGFPLLNRDGATVHFPDLIKPCIQIRWDTCQVTKGEKKRAVVELRALVVRFRKSNTKLYL